MESEHHKQPARRHTPDSCLKEAEEQQDIQQRENSREEATHLARINGLGELRLELQAALLRLGQRPLLGLQEAR